MDSQNTHRSYDDNRETEKSQLSHRSVGKNSEVSLRAQSDKNKNKDRGYSESVTSDRARTRTRDPDRDRISDYEKNSDHYYSDEYENLSPSDGSRSLSPCSRSPSPSPQKVGRVNQVSSRPPQRKALHRAGSKAPRHSGPQRWGVHSQSLNKDSPPKDLDLVTKRVLSARLLKINEQRNELTELQLRLDELQKENKVLRQLQHRQERALNKFEDTENEIAQLISRHNNEVHVLRERLRRAQERERATDRRLKDTEEELHRSKTALQKLRKLAEDRHLGEREELARKVAQAQGRLQDNERKIKELERNMELSSSSFQRQLAAERKKTHEVQEEVRNLQAELERLTQKLKEKERELDTRNIYANRMGKAASKKEMDNSTKKKGLSYEVPSRTSSKGVQTEDRMLSLDFPTPPPAVTDGPEHPREDDYFSLKGGRRSPSALLPAGTPQRTGTKELQEAERTQRAVEDDWHAVEKERSESEEKRQELRTGDEKAVKLQDGEKEEDRKGHGQTVVQKEEENRKRRGLSLFQVHQEPDEEKKETSEELSLEKMEEERQRKEQLLAKMREIDQQAQNTELFSDGPEPRAVRSPSWLSEPKNQRPSTFNFPESVENLHKGLPSQESGDSLKKLGSSGRRGLKPQTSSEDLSFGSYAPSFGRPSGRPGVTNQRADGAEDKHRDNLDVDFRKEKKSNLMQQLFGASVSTDTSSKMEVLSPPPARKPSQQNGSPFPWESSKKKESFFSSNNNKPASSTKSPLHVAENRPTVRAISSFDDDIEEVTL